MSKTVTGGIILIALLILTSQARKVIFSARADSADPSVDIVVVSPGISVTITVRNLLPGDAFNILMDAYGSPGAGGSTVAMVTSGEGSFTATFAIPKPLKDTSKIAVRLENLGSGLIAYNWFWNQPMSRTISFPFIARADPPGPASPAITLEAAHVSAIVVHFPFISLSIPSAVTPTLKPVSPDAVIGLIPGHTGANPRGVNIDPGAVCLDGLTEQSVNLKIARLVKQDLEKTGYEVELLDEHDPRLNSFKGLLLLSIHNDSCDVINQQATGFKVAGNLYNTASDPSNRLTSCLINRYRKDTGLRFDFTSITPAMTRYHAFFEVSHMTPSAIIEAGFLYLDRKILTKHTDSVANGITDGILCFLRNEYVGNTQP